MLAALVAAVVGVPDTPTLVFPTPDGGWSPSGYVGFELSPYRDVSGAPQSALAIELRRPGGGFDAGFTRNGMGTYLQPQFDFGPEASTWVWRARYTNNQGQSSAWSAEAEFRIDDTDPTPPVSIDAGLVDALGCTVRVDFTPGTDALSGIDSHALVWGPTPTGPWYDWIFSRPGPPLLETLGAGSWWVWADSFDRADNHSGRSNGTGPIIGVTIAFDPTLPVLPPPVWNNPPSPSYGELAEWNVDRTADAGFDQVVFSFCNVDAGCLWIPAPGAAPVTERYRWVQPEREGFYRLRIAGVRGDRVSAWSQPSATIVLDRTGPACGATTALLVDAGTVLVSWADCIEALTDVASLTLEERRVGGAVLNLSVTGTSATRQPGSGTWQWRIRATDTFGNVGDFGLPSSAITLSDAGAVDAGPAVDAGSDAGVDAGVDAGAPPDAGAPFDAGTPEPDAGIAGPDGGEPPALQAYEIRCGCGSGGPFLLLLLVALLLRRSHE